MAKIPRGKPGYPKDFLEQARASVEKGDVVYDAHALHQVFDLRGLTNDDLRDAILSSEASVDTWPQNVRFDQQRGVYLRQINTKLGIYQFCVIGYFYLPEDAKFPHIFSVHTAFVVGTPQGKRPIDIWASPEYGKYHHDDA